MGPANGNYIKEILQHYIGDTKIENLDYNELVNQFEKVKPTCAYSNSQIENIITKKIPKNIVITQKDLVQIINQTNPVIKNDKIIAFQEQQESLNGEI